ncbi:MAG: hypothetical protein HOK28_10530 [Deltaproteobacteria bacterium]|jgi:hypothetical protein|nr:hypothetical protein [Deltaproteobacteria bacterium]
MTKIVRKLLNFFLGLVKWPLAFLMIYLLPDSILEMLELLEKSELESDQVAPFIYGFLGYFAAWFVLFKRYFMGSWLSTLEHELTHGLFAVITFHKITELKTSYLSGGHIRYTGGGNWLITIAPYFFPTLSFLIMGILSIVGTAETPWLNLALGVSVAYHLTSTWHETHLGQTDIKEVGYLYSFLFLPAANIISYIAILAFVLGGPGQLLESLSFIQEAMAWTP